MHVQTQGEEEAHSERDTEDVVDTCPDEVAADNREDLPRQMQGRDHIQKVGAHKDDVSGFDGDGRARRKRDADGGSDKSWGVVDTISDLNVRMSELNKKLIVENTVPLQHHPGSSLSSQ